MSEISRVGWRHLLTASLSSDGDQRRVALIRAYSWVEHALAAISHSNRRVPIAARLLKAQDLGLLGDKPSLEETKYAISARHAVAHADNVLSPPDCSRAVHVLYLTWFQLRASYLQSHQPVDLFQKLSSFPDIAAVLVYGSYARAAPRPSDIDILLLDQGRYSRQIRMSRFSYADRVELTVRSLTLLGLIRQLKDAARCRWIDISIIDGSRLGTDYAYTEHLVGCQPDPYFFLNIAVDIQEYTSSTGGLSPCKHAFFERLRKIGEALAKAGLPPNHFAVYDISKESIDVADFQK